MTIQLRHSRKAAEYEQAITAAVLMDVLAKLGIWVRLTPAQDSYSLNYNRGTVECSTAVRKEDLVAHLTRLTDSQIKLLEDHVKKLESQKPPKAAKHGNRLRARAVPTTGRASARGLENNP